jgi:hypothetical protein
MFEQALAETTANFPDAEFKKNGYSGIPDMPSAIAPALSGPFSFFRDLTQRERLAWAAGFVDGDGCISSVVQTRPGKRPSYRIRIDISQNDPFPLLLVRQILQHRSALNPIKRQTFQNRQNYQLTYDGRHTAAVLELLLPFLVRKRAEATTCLDLWNQGKLWLKPGAAGTPDELLQVRAKLHNRIRALK